MLVDSSSQPRSEIRWRGSGHSSNTIASAVNRPKKHTPASTAALAPGSIERYSGAIVSAAAAQIESTSHSQR